MYESIKQKIYPNYNHDSIHYFNFMDNLKFQKIIDLNQYNNLDYNEKKEYLISNNIFIKGSKCSETYIDTNNEDIDNFENTFVYKNNYYEIDENIKNEFYDCIYHSIESEDILSNSPLVDFENIDFQLEYLPDTNQKLDFLKKIYDKNLRIFLQFTRFHPDTKQRSPYLENGIDMHWAWKDLITEHFGKELFGYLSTGGIGPLRNKKDPTKRYGVIANWCEMYSAKKLLDYSKELILVLNKKTSLNNSEKLNKKTIAYPPFNSLIFKSIDSQKIFYNTLIEFGAIDENFKFIKRRFQPICDAIFNKHLIFFDEMFKYELSKKDYILFLEAAFEGTIKDKSRLSDGSKHLSKVKSFILSSLNELSKTKG